MRIVFDLDGTLADNTHRTHFIEGETKDWDGFFEACDKDTPIFPAIYVLTTLLTGSGYRGESHRLEIWSGRGEGMNESVKNKTISWILKFLPARTILITRKKEEFFTKYENTLSVTLRMRSHGDFTPDHELKKQWLHEARMQNAAPELVFDDRQRVVDMWRDEGIPCFQVAPGEF